MTDSIDFLFKRHSVRSYAERPIPDAEREAILKATLRAPTAGNMMLYSVLEIRDPALKNRLAETCDHQPFIAKAPLVLAFLADYQRWFDYFILGGVEELCAQRGQDMRLPQEGDLFLAMCDTLIAAQTAVVAAEAMGIGSCYIGDFLENYEIHRDLLHLPRYVLPITLICFGYPAEDAARRPLTSRFDPEYIIHTDTYQRLDATRLGAMFRESNAELPERARKAGFQNAGQALYFRKFASDFMLEMNRSVQVMLKSWAQSIEEKHHEA